MKIYYFFLMLFASGFLFSQAGYNNMTNHQKGNFSIEPAVDIGKNNKGLGLMFGYYLGDFFTIRAGATFRKFEYRSYTEDILEGNIEGVYTVYSPRYDDPFLHKFNFAVVGGFAYENVKETSRTTLIDPYPKHIYFYGGGQLEFSASEKIGIVANFRQYYALNGSKDKLGNWRFDYGLGVRLYLWGRY